MPRPRQAHGRPGTRVVPRGFEAEHALVFDGTRTAAGRIWAQPDTPATIGTDLSYATGPTQEPVYEGPMRVQELARSEVERLFGDEYQTVVVYLVTLPLDTNAVERGHLLEVTEATDPRMGRMTVVRATAGSVRWERHVYAVADQQRSAA